MRVGVIFPLLHLLIPTTMNKRAFKPQASSSRVALGATSTPFGSASNRVHPVIEDIHVSPLAYTYEPLDLGGILDPIVVVALKNLQKKDGTTKTKALEEIQAYAKTHREGKEGVDDALLGAWVKLYPRTSIDNDRRVRQLSHTVQGTIAVAAGKRLAKHMTALAGAWLSGLHDNDKTVVRAALESFHKVFVTPEKQKGVYKAYQGPIIEYCKNAVLREDEGTLSDERTVRPDESKAKYHRVVGSSIATITDVLEHLSDEEVKRQNFYKDVLQSEKVWKLSTKGEAFLRRSIYKFLVVALKRLKDLLNVGLLRTYVLRKGLIIPQIGSANEYARVLAQLTSSQPDIWDAKSFNGSKSSPTQNLCHFLREGAQGGSAEFWRHLSTTFAHLPGSILSSHQESNDSEPPSAHVALKALQTGIYRLQDHDTNQGEAWKCYFHLMERLQSLASEYGNGDVFVEHSILPFIHHYVRPAAPREHPFPSSVDQQEAATKAVLLAFRVSAQKLERGLKDLSAILIQDLETSLPEQSQDYVKSQDAVVAQLLRWYKLLAILLREVPGQPLQSVLTSNASAEQRAAMATIRNRNGKPYSAAAFLDLGARITPEITIKQSGLGTELLAFAEKDIPSLMSSPSASYLIRFLDSLSSLEDMQHVYQDCLKALINAPDSPGKLSALRSTLSSPWPKTNDSSKILADFLEGELQHVLQENARNWSLLDTAIASSFTPKYTISRLLVMMTNSLSIDGEVLPALHGIKTALDRNKYAMRAFVASSDGPLMLSRLLFLSQMHDDEATRELAAKVKDAYDGLLSDGSTSKLASNPVVEIIKRGIVDISNVALPIDSLVDQAQLLIQEATLVDPKDILEDLLPDEDSWLAAYEPFFNQKVDTSLALTNNLGGAIHLVEQNAEMKGATDRLVLLDREGYSAAFRIAAYVTKLANSIVDFTSLSEDCRATTFRFIAIFSQIASDHVSVQPDHGLWETSEEDLEHSVVDAVADAQALSVRWARSALSTEGTYIDGALRDLYSKSGGNSAKSYYNARAYACVALELKEQGWFVEKDEEVRAALELHGESKNIFGILAVLKGIPWSKATLKLCNELVAKLSDWAFETDSEEGLRGLIMLNNLLENEGVSLQDIPQHRLVIFVKHIVEGLRYNAVLESIRAEMLKALNSVLWRIKDIYGDLWQEIIDVIICCLSSKSSSLVAIHASLRLCSTLKTLTTDGCNEDLEECFTASQKAIADALLQLLQVQSVHSDANRHPRKMVNSLLARQLTVFLTIMNPDPQQVYPVVACESTVLQCSAYRILHHKIPAEQEEVSLEAALSKGYNAKLPEELLSLILEPPRSQEYSRFQTEPEVPSPVARYLFSWQLVFDHWTNASYKVHSDYVTCIKDGTYLKDLLDFTFGFLMRNQDSNRVFNPSRFTIQDYSPGVEGRSETDVQWLLSHLYYLSLKHLPLLCRSWWRSNCPRSLEKQVEEWTEKYISPLIIQAEFSAVSDWDPNTGGEADAPALEIKVSPRARELTASYPIDDQNVAIRVCLPPAYPLQPATFVSARRVGFDERKWSAWLNASQIITNFAPTSQGLGCVIDGLVAWRRNVVGALKGQKECAICYSIVGADGALPTKRCATCKNIFHGGCLFRWFKSSSSSGCPLCRNPFSYG